MTTRALPAEEVKELYDEFDQVVRFGCDDEVVWRWRDGNTYDPFFENWNQIRMNQ